MVQKTFLIQNRNDIEFLHLTPAPQLGHDWYVTNYDQKKSYPEELRNDGGFIEYIKMGVKNGKVTYVTSE